MVGGVGLVPTDVMMSPADLVHMVESLMLVHKELTWFPPQLNIAQEVVGVIGGGTGSISLDSWTSWMCRGARRPALERAKVSCASPELRRLNTFLESVLTVVRQRALLKITAQSEVEGYRRGAGRHTAGYTGHARFAGSRR